MGLSIDCARFHCDQHAHSEVILKENKTDDIICLLFGVHVYICGHMIPSSVNTNHFQRGISGDFKLSFLFLLNKFL